MQQAAHSKHPMERDFGNMVATVKGGVGDCALHDLLVIFEYCRHHPANVGGGTSRLTVLSGTESAVAEYDNVLETEMLNESTSDGENRAVEWVGF